LRSEEQKDFYEEKRMSAAYQINDRDEEDIDEGNKSIELSTGTISEGEDDDRGI